MIEKLLGPLLENAAATLREYPPDYFLRAGAAALLAWFYRVESTRERDWEKLATSWGLDSPESAKTLYRMVLATMVRESERV